MESEVLLANFRGLLRPTVLPTSLVKDLTPDERQIVEFLMALSAKPKVLILAWASEKTEYAPQLAEIGNLHYFRRELDSFVAAALGQRSAEISAPHARDILKLIAACYESSANAGQEVPLN
jgi:hypothetical protein